MTLTEDQRALIHSDLERTGAATFTITWHPGGYIEDCQPAKRVPGEVTSLLDPMNVSDEALTYRREMNPHPWPRDLVEVLPDHDCEEGEFWDDDEEVMTCDWLPLWSSESWSGYIEKRFEWEEEAA